MKGYSLHSCSRKLLNTSGLINYLGEKSKNPCFIFTIITVAPRAANSRHDRSNQSSPRMPLKAHRIALRAISKARETEVGRPRSTPSA